jgi:preprotein translocase subunit SecF
MGHISAYINVFFFLAVWLIKELQVHPFKLLMIVAALEGAFALIYFNSQVMCDWHFNYLLAATLRWDVSCAS